MSNLLLKRIVEKTMHTVGAGNSAIARELLTIFFQEIRSSETALPQFWAERDFKNLGMAAHKMAGACAYFGADELFAALLKIESLCKKEDVVGLAEVFHKAHLLIEEVAQLESEVCQAIK